MDKKIIVIGLLFTVLLISSFSLVSASYVCPAAHTGSQVATGFLEQQHPSSVSKHSAYAQIFTANSTAYLWNSTFMLKKEGLPQGFLACDLYSVTGTVGTNAIPTGSALATSSLFDVSDLAGSYLEITFYYDGSYQIVDETSYALVLYVQTETNTWNIGVTDVNVYMASALASINKATFESSTWTATSGATSQLWFVVNGDTTSSAPPTPTPVGVTATPSATGDAGMEALTNALLPILVPLLVVLIPAFLGLKFVGAWGFMAGLNVGVIIAYVTLGATAYAFPLWGVVLVGIVDVLLVMKARG